MENTTLRELPSFFKFETFNFDNNFEYIVTLA